MRQRIKRADQVAAYWEAVRLADFAETEAARFFGRPGRIGAEAIAALLEPWPAKRAESRYLASFKALAEASFRAARMTASTSARCRAWPRRCRAPAPATW